MSSFKPNQLLKNYVVEMNGLYGGASIVDNNDFMGIKKESGRVNLILIPIKHHKPFQELL